MAYKRLDAIDIVLFAWSLKFQFELNVTPKMRSLSTMATSGSIGWGQVLIFLMVKHFDLLAFIGKESAIEKDSFLWKWDDRVWLIRSTAWSTFLNWLTSFTTYGLLSREPRFEFTASHMFLSAAFLVHPIFDLWISSRTFIFRWLKTAKFPLR